MINFVHIGKKETSFLVERLIKFSEKTNLNYRSTHPRSSIQEIVQKWSKLSFLVKLIYFSYNITKTLKNLKITRQQHIQKKSKKEKKNKKKRK